MNSKSFFILTFCFAISIAVNAQETGYFTDERDHHNYKYVTIGDQVWMAENLGYRPAEGSTVYYHSISDPDTIQNNKFFGRLYDFETALKVCPDGWHLPSDEEWTVLTEFLGGDIQAGGKMKTVGTTDDTGLWNPPNKDATNESGFSGVGGGYRNSDGYCTASNHYGVYWSSTKKSEYKVWSRELTYQYGELRRFPKNIAHQNSVRCIKDNE